MKITVIIPVKNGAQTLEKCLSSIRNQTFENIEIIVLDSMSTDGSREIADKYCAKIIPVPEGAFDHGLTRNIGAENASGDLLFFTVQDAWLSENDMLGKMGRHFEDERVMGVVGHQAVPHEKDKNPLLWYKRFSEPKITIREVKDIEQFRNASSADQRSLIAWDDVAAMYRKTALRELPFVQTVFGEDWVWSYQALLKGWKLLYDPSLVIYHYHHQTYEYAYKSSYTYNYHFYKFFKYKPGIPPLIQQMARATYHLGKHSGLTLKEKLYWIRHNYARSLGIFNSNVNFLFCLYTGGIKSIEKRYQKVCRIITQGQQNSD